MSLLFTTSSGFSVHFIRIVIAVLRQIKLVCKASTERRNWVNGLGLILRWRGLDAFTVFKSELRRCP